MHRHRLGRFTSQKTSAGRDFQFRARLEPLEDRKMLSAVTWTVDQAQSSATLAVPDQPFEITSGTTTYTGTLRVRNQGGNNAGPWSVGNTAAIAGTIATDYVDGSSIQFLTGLNNLVGVNSGNYRPNPAAWNGTEFTPDGTTGPGVFGGRLYPTVNVGIPLTVDVGFFNFSDLSYDMASGVLPIAAGSFAANTTDVGIESVTANLEGVSILIVGQILPDTQALLTDISATNESPNATITTPDPVGNPNLRELTFPISMNIAIEIDPGVPALMGSISGQVVAHATLPDPTEVVGRQIFYNQSKFDGFTAGIDGVSDDMAIAPDKSAYLPGSGAATFDNITSYSRGINGVMVDMQNVAGTLTVDDFTFRMSTQSGANNTPSTWEAAPAPSGFSVRPGEGISGSDRVEIVWDSGVISNRWLEVIVEGDDAVGGNNTNTGLAESDRFYFGNRIGDTGSGTPGLAITSALDEIAARNNAGFGATLTNLYDFDRSGLVTAVDNVIARNNSGTLTKINLTDPPAVPLVAGDDSAVAIGLAAPEKSDASTTSAPTAEGGSSSESSSAAASSAPPVVEDSSADELASAVEDVADESGLDDDLLDDLLG